MGKEQITTRPATVDDIVDLVRMRRRMFKSMGFDQPALDASEVSWKDYFREVISNRSFYGWMAIMEKGEAVSCGGVVIDQHPPGPSNLSGRIGYVMNLFTDPAYRRQGLASCILSIMIEWICLQGIIVSALHVTGMARSLYDKFGFSDNNEMLAKL